MYKILADTMFDRFICENRARQLASSRGGSFSRTCTSAISKFKLVVSNLKLVLPESLMLIIVKLDVFLQCMYDQV